MSNPFFRVFPMVFACLLSACGGGGGDAPTPAPTARDAATAYVGTWTLSCTVTTPPDATYPDGISEDEVLTVTRLADTRFATSSVRSIYANGSCATHTSYTRGFPVTSQVEIVGTRPASEDQLLFRPDDGSPSFKAIALVQGTMLYVTRSDAAGAVLDAEGYPQALDISRAFIRTP